MIGDFKAQIVHFSHSFFLKDLNFDHGQFCATFVIALLIDKLTENIARFALVFHCYFVTTIMVCLSANTVFRELLACGDTWRKLSIT